MVTHQQVTNKLAESYRMDLIESIELAKEGMLSPSGQEYCFEEIESHKGTKGYPVDGDVMLREIRKVLESVPQITETEHEIMEAAAFGGTLLLFVYLDRGTLLEVVEYPEGEGYYGLVFINGEKHKGKVCAVLQILKEELDKWVKDWGMEIHPSNQPNTVEIGRFSTLQETLEFLYTALEYPNESLI